MSCLGEPSEKRNIRQPDMLFVEALKEEMITNPLMEVAPIIGLLILPEGEEFIPAHCAAYKYETIGGNHSRMALQEILKSQDNPLPVYTHRIVSVYHGLSDTEVQHLAHRHNRASGFHHSMTTQDKVKFRSMFFIRDIMYMYVHYIMYLDYTCSL